MNIRTLAMNLILAALAPLAANAASSTPIAPSNLTASSSGSQVVLRWSDNSSNEQGFIIEGSSSNSTGFTRLSSVASGVVSSTLSLPSVLPYYYRVAAYSKVRRQYVYSAYSNIASLSSPSTTTTSTTTTTTVPTSTFRITSAPVALNITSSSADIQWSLSEVATGQVEYGTSTAYGNLSTPELSFNYSTHQQHLSGLTAGTVYHYRVISSNQAGVKVVSGDYTFATLSVTTTTSTTSTTTTTAPTTTTTLTSGSLPYTKPALINPVSPITYGAKCDGVTDDSAAFAAALKASDVFVPAGRDCVINREVQILTSNRHLECGDGAILRMTTPYGRMLLYLAPSGGRLSGNSIVNCHFIGANTEAPQADWSDTGKHYNIPVETQDRVDNFFLAGNTFERFWGQSMFQTLGDPDGGHGDQIVYNTFRSCGYYGPVFVSHTNGLIANNTMVDCAAGIENDNSTQNTGNNIVENNVLTCKYGYGGPDMQACAMLTGGVAGNADYSTNIVRNNSISGVSNGLGFQPAQGSRLIRGANWGVKAAQYLNNTCGPGCVYTP